MLDILGLVFVILIVGPNELRMAVLKVLGGIAMFFLFAYLLVEHPLVFAVLATVSLIYTVWDAVH